jgi:CrcB protein
VSAAVLVSLGLLGGVGAVARFALDAAVSGRLGRAFPYGTLAVNATGALALGVLVGAALHGDAYRLAGTGLLGAYTTFSTFSYETLRLLEDGALLEATLNVATSLAVGLAAAAAGLGLTLLW